MMGHEQIIIAITVVIVVLSVYRYADGFDSEVTRVRSTVDNRTYLVLRLPDSNKAADQLAKLRIKMERFIAGLDNNAGNARLRQRFRAILSESKPGAKFTSYTVNKGSNVYMCIRERDENNRVIDENTLFFVALHELAHIMTVSIGHTAEFWNNFRYLLNQAIKGRFYQYQPYHHTPAKYCGTYISDTPLKL